MKSQSTPSGSRSQRWAACFVTTTTLLCSLSLPAASAIIAHYGTFEDPSDPEVDGDEFTLTNDPTSEANIITLEIDLSYAPLVPGVDFDTADYPFTPTPSSAALTGFVSAVLTGTTLLTLTFTDFEPNETFRFAIDVDDLDDRVEAVNITGSLIDATFDIFGGTDLSAAMLATDVYETNWTNSATVVPEPGTLSLLSLGLIGLAWEARRARISRAH